MAGTVGAVAVVVVVLGLVFGIPVLIWVSAGGDLADIGVEEGDLVVRPHRLNRVWALAREVRVPVLSITDVRTGVPRRQAPSGWRVGTYLPGVMQAGTFRWRGRRSFWLVGRTSAVTVVDCPGARFDHLVLDLPADQALALRRSILGR